MNATGEITLDGRPVPIEDGDTVMTAAHRAGIHVPHLCWHPALGQSGACRVCTVTVDGRAVAACTTRAAPGMRVENRTEALDAGRRLLVQMLFVEGNHFCPGCEKSGDCLLQETAYDMGMREPHFEELYPRRPLDASHPDTLIDFDRCILCKLCVRASHEVDRKDVFAIGAHGIDTHLLVSSPTGKLGDSTFSAGDLAAGVCPVGAILPKRRGFAVPIGERRFDRASLDEEARARADRSPGVAAASAASAASAGEDGGRSGAGRAGGGDDDDGS